MHKKDVAELLNDIGVMLELKGENPFKSRAYYNAAHTIETLEEDLSLLVSEGRLMSVKGIGNALSEKIAEFVTVGKLGYYDELRAEIPEGLFEILRIPGLGPRKVHAIYKHLSVATIGELEYACRENRLKDLEGFGEKSEEKILRGIANLKKYKNNFLHNEARTAANGILAELGCVPAVKRCAIAGSLRRYKEIIKDVDILVSTEDPEAVVSAFVSLPKVVEVVAHGRTKSSVVLESGINADLRVVTDKEFPYALLHFTGSKEHNIAMRARAIKRKMKLNEYGLFRGDEIVPCKDEAAVFKTLGLPYIPPEMREDTGEIAAAEKNELPELITEKDVKGVFHIHSEYSDGKVPLEEMARAAIERGWEYMGVSDHSESARYANGLEKKRLRKQFKEIDALNKKLAPFRIFKGIESEIHSNGTLDYDKETLKSFDFVIASVHSGFTMSEREMTARILTAVRNPLTTMLGHPTGRLLLRREAFELDMEAVIRSCAKNGVVIELNANPYRLDLDWRWHRVARENGVKISINPDAHNPESFDFVQLGVGIARKGWLTRNDIFNVMGVKEIEAFFQARKKGIRS